MAIRGEPTATPVMFQTWSQLLFLHWECDPSEIQATLPPGLFVDTFDGHAYVSVIPFMMSEIRAAFLPAIPGASTMLETNVRTYVHDQHGRPGVWFYSLECNHTLAVEMAKYFYGLPYHRSQIEAAERIGVIEYRCHRLGTTEEFRSEFQFKALPERVSAPPGSLPFFLVERYLLYSWFQAEKKLYSARVHHQPYELFKPQLGRYDDHLLRLNGFKTRLEAPKYLQLAPNAMRVKIYAPEEVPRS